MPDDLENRFTYHPPTAEQIPLYEEIRPAGKALARMVLRMVPAGPERDKALDSIDQAIMWANAGIARRTPPSEGDSP
jgi:hypothetical protein